MSTWLAVSKSRPIRDTRRPLPTRKVAEAPLSPRYARDRRTEGERSVEGWGSKSTGTTEEKGQTSGAKHHPPRAPKGTYVCGCMYHSYPAAPRRGGGFLSSLPVAHSRTTPRCSTAQLLNTARTTRLRHDGEHAVLSSSGPSLRSDRMPRFIATLLRKWPSRDRVLIEQEFIARALHRTRSLLEFGQTCL